MNDPRRTLLPVLAGRRRRRRAVPGPGRPRLGDRARLHRVRHGLHRRCAVRADGRPPALGGAGRRGRCSSCSSPRRADRFTAFMDIAGAQGPPQLPDVPGADQHRHRRAHRARASAAGNAQSGSCRWPTATSSSPSIAEELGFVGVDRRARRVRPAGLRRRAGRAGQRRPLRHAAWPAGSSAGSVVQTMINVGGVTGLMPVTGLTLPFFSAGGSSLFVTMVAGGLLLNVARNVDRERRAARRAGSGSGSTFAVVTGGGIGRSRACRRWPSPRGSSPRGHDVGRDPLRRARAAASSSALRAADAVTR